MAGTTGSNEFEILAADGVNVFGVSLIDEVDRHGDLRGLRRGYDAQLSPADADSPLADWLEPIVQEDWSGGVGVHSNATPGCYTRTPGHVLPAGAATTVTIPAGGSAQVPIVAFCEYGNDLYAAEEGDAINGGRVLLLTGGTGAAWTVSLALAAGEIIRDLCVFDNGAGVNYLYASSTSSSGLSGRLHRTLDGVTWTHTDAAGTGAGHDFGTGAASGRNRMRREFWKTADGFGASRLIVISSGNTIAYTRPNLDPFNAASWVEGVPIGTDTYIDELAGARRHIWIGSKSDVHDLNELGESPGLMGYQNRTPSGIRFPIQYYNGYVYRAGANTLDRIYVDTSTAVLQEKPQQCAPGFGTPAENEWRGYPTAFAIEQGYLVTSIWNPTTGRSGIFWGIERNTPGIDNPLAWFGPEIVSTGFRRVTAMAPSMLAGDRRMWVASVTSNGTRETIWVSLPVAGAPIQDLISGGTHRFATGDGTGNWQARCQVLSLSETAKDKNSLKIVDQNGIGSRGLDSNVGTKLTVYTRADPTPGSQAWGSGVDVTSGPIQALTPAVTTKGYKLEYRIDLISPSGGASPPLPAMLDAVRRTVWRIVPSLTAVTLNVQYGDRTRGVNNTEDSSIHPNQITAWLKELTESDRTVVRYPDDQRRSVKFRQVLDLHAELSPHGRYGKKVTAKIMLADLGQG